MRIFIGKGMTRVFIGEGGYSTGLHVWTSEFTSLFNFGFTTQDLQGDYWVALWFNFLRVGVRVSWWRKKPVKDRDWRFHGKHWRGPEVR